jgi:hypothetical protein
VTVVYRPRPFPRIYAAWLGVMAVGAAATLAVRIASGNGDLLVPAIFGALCAYWAWTEPIEVAMSAEEIRWRSALTRHSSPVAALQEVHPGRWRSVVLEFRDGRALRVRVNDRFLPFLTALRAARPDIPVRAPSPFDGPSLRS